MKSLLPDLRKIKIKCTCTFIHVCEVIWRLLQIKFRAVDWFLFLAAFIGLGFQPDFDFIPANLIITSAFMLILTFLSWCNGTLVENFLNLWGTSESFDYFCGGGKDRKSCFILIGIFNKSVIRTFEMISCINIFHKVNVHYLFLSTVISKSADIFAFYYKFKGAKSV